MIKKVFISYSSEDKSVAELVCDNLEKRRIKCWIAHRDVSEGEKYSAIIDAIDNSDIFILIFSSNSNRSPKVKREVERAVNQGIPIIPFRIEDVMPSKSMEYFISKTQWLDAFKPPLEKNINSLAKTIYKLRETQEDLKKRKSKTSKKDILGWWGRQNKFLKVSTGIVALVCLAVVLYMVYNGTLSKAPINYAQNGISFQYPGTWTENDSNELYQVYVQDSDKASVGLIKDSLPPGKTFNQFLDYIYTGESKNFLGFQSLSNETVTIDGNFAHEQNYIRDIGGKERKVREIFFEKNGTVYAIICTSKTEEFDNEQRSFNLILNSFKIQ